MDIVHISRSPLVSAPARLSDTLNRFSQLNSIHFIEKDYPKNLKGIMSNQSIVLEGSEHNYRLLKECIKKSSIVHIHNEISESLELFILSINSDAKYIYHIHSPLKEGPVYTRFEDISGIDFDYRLAVAQYPPRMYQNYQPVMNIIPYEPSYQLVGDMEKVKIMFSPAHKRKGGRWGDKVSDKLQIALESLNEFNKINLVECSGVTPFNLFELRKQCHVTIDEIITGAYHQVSLEGLAAGNVVINNSDFLTNIFLERQSGYSDPAPFVRACEEDIFDVLMHIASNKKFVRDKQIESYSFFDQHLRPQKLVKQYIDVYEKVIC